MTLALPVQQETCPHLYRSRCDEAARLLGYPAWVSPQVCRVSCPKWGGPHGGREISDEQRGKWTAKMLRYMWGPIAQKVGQRYAKPFDVWIPPIVQSVREAFQFVTEHPNVIGLGLTGSILSRETKATDVDVMVVVKSLRDWLDAPIPTPRTIDGLKVDVFIGTSFENYFMVLDISTNRLYKTGAYNIASIDPRIEVIDCDNAIYTAFRRELESKKVQPQKRPCVEVPSRAVPREQWPIAAKAVAKLATDADKGVGDTLTRLLAAAGGEVIKGIAKGLGYDCGCVGRANTLDAMYPYNRE